jgi:threonine/homoserine/homoserine lactone efflux protein
MLNVLQVTQIIPPLGLRELIAMPLFFGFLSAFIGIMPPGLINMTAAKVSIKEGRRNAIWFITGAIVVICIQASFAVLFAKIINNRPDFVTLMREVGCAIFTILSIYFLWIAKKPKKKTKKLPKKSKTKRFFLGMLLSFLNFFPIPYYVFVGVTLASFDLFYFDAISIFFFVSGTTLGSFLVFYLYITFFGHFESKSDYLLKNMNTMIGSVTAIIALITLIKIIKSYS